MKSSLAVAIVCAFVISAQGDPVAVKNKVAALATKCSGESGIPADAAQLAFNQEIPKDEKERCYLDCVYRGVDVTDGQNFNLEGSMNLVHARFQKPDEVEKATHLVETCSKEIKANANEKCSLGRTVRECFVLHGKTVNFFPSAI